MGDAKQLVVKPISAQDAEKIIKRLHYSGKVVNNSQIHLGVFMGNRCGGAMQFGPSMCKANMLGLVKGTQWNEFIELNRLAFADWLPRNGESRCIAFALRWIRTNFPWIKWVISYADGTQCGDGTIYRATGFLLTGIKKNVGLRINTADGKVMQKISAYHKGLEYDFDKWNALPGFQLRYIYFLHANERDNLAVPVMPYSAIDEAGAGMYKGQKRKLCDGSIVSMQRTSQSVEGGSTPTPSLQPAGKRKRLDRRCESK